MISIQRKGIKRKSPLVFSCRLLWVLPPFFPVTWDRQALTTTQTEERVRERKGKQVTLSVGRRGCMDLSSTTAKATLKLFIYSLDAIRQRGLNSKRGPRSLFFLCSKRYIIAPKARQMSLKEWGKLR